jgi:hypothetical protein
MNNVDVDNVLNTITTTIDELKESINPEVLSKDDKTEIKHSLSKVIRLAIKVKLQYQQKRISNLIQELENETTDIDKMKRLSDKVEAALNSEAA